MSTRDQPFTKGEVDRAGKRWAKLALELRSGASIKDLSADRARALVNADRAISWWRHLHVGPLAAVNANLRYYLRDLDGPVTVTQRLKRQPTIIDKLLREPTMKLTQMGDIGGVRAIVASRKEITTVSRALRKNWDIGTPRDYIASPKPSGYRALHLIVKRKGCRIEVQLRTPLQDEWANGVEEDSRRLAIGLKSGVGPDVIHEYYVAVSLLFDLTERGLSADDELLERLRDLYARARPHLDALT